MLKAAVQISRYFKWPIDNEAEGRFYEAKQNHTPPGLNCRVEKNQVYGYIDSSYMSEEQPLCRFGVSYYINGMSAYEMSRRLPDHYLSSTEAEYYACSIGTCEGQFLVMALTAMGKTQSGPLLVQGRATTPASRSQRIRNGIMVVPNMLSCEFAGLRTKSRRRSWL